MKKAFTFIEFLIVVAIAAILLALVIGHYMKAGKGIPVATQYPSSTNSLERAKPPTSAGYDVQLLFMINGMRIYRFYDNGRYIYVADGRDSKTSWEETTPAGKAVITTLQEVQTVK